VDTPAPDGPLRIAIRAQRRLLRDTLAMCLAGRPHLEVVGHVAGVDDLMTLCDLSSPHVVLLALAEESPRTWLPEVRGRAEEACLVLLYETMSADELVCARQAGADVMLPGGHGFDALLAVLDRCADKVASQSRPATPPLTETEREILTLLGTGHTARRIAGLLQTTTNEVDNAKRRIYHRLGVATGSQAVARAVVLGLIERHVPGDGDHPPPVEGAPLVVVGGADGPARQQVVTILLGHGIPFVLREQASTLDPASWVSWQRGPLILVLVDPGSDDLPDPHSADVITGAAPLPVVVVRTRPQRRDTAEALGRGAGAVICVDRVVDDLVPAVTLAARGYLTVDALAARGVFRASRPAADTGVPELTARECDILHSIAEGHTVRQTARTLGIAAKTVENTQARLFRKLGARNRAAALTTAHAIGLLERAAP